MIVRKSIGFIVCAIPFAAVAASYPRTVKARAGSLHYAEGIDASGLTFRGEDCPFVVEKEVLTLNIPHFPDASDGVYNATVTADYTFFNPEDRDVTVNLLFPYGECPEYAAEKDNLKSASVTVGGEPAACAVRYTYDCYRQLAIGEAVERISEDRRTDSFYKETMSVTPYVCTFSLPNGFRGKLCFIYDLNPKKSQIVFAEEHRAKLSVGIVNGYCKAEYEIGDALEESIRFYAVGEEPAEILVAFVDSNGTEQKADDYTLKAEEKISFADFAMKGRRTGGAISEIDYYNAFVDMLDFKNGGVGITAGDKLEEKSLVRWCEYELTLAAGERAQSCVTAPLYPTIEGRPARYEYSYLLSPAQKWANFKEIDVIIETPYYLTRSSLEFTRLTAENDVKQYAFSRDGLPQGELTFVLSETEESFSYGPLGKKFLSGTLVVTVVVLSVTAVAAAVITVSIVLSMSKKKKK